MGVKASGLKKVKEHLRKNGATENIVNIFKAVLATAPFTGGIASLLSDYLPSQRQLRLEDFAHNVAEELNKLEAEVSGEYILTDEFAFIFEKCFKGAIENYQQEKIDAFKAVLVNSLTNNGLKQNEKEYYLNLVNNLSVLHIQILSFMAAPRQFLKKHNIEESKVSGGFENFFPVVIPDVSLSIIKLAFKDLYNYGFLNTDSSIFTAMTVNKGWSLLGDRVTPTGKKFIKFITLGE
jgi:hypothetical protein